MMEPSQLTTLRWAQATRHAEGAQRSAVRCWCAPARGVFGLLESSGAEGLRALETYMRAQDGDALAFMQAHQSLVARAAWGHALIARWDGARLTLAQAGDARWIWVRGDEVLAWRWGRAPRDDYYEGPPTPFTGGSAIASRQRRDTSTWLGMLDGLPHASPWPQLSALEARPGDTLVLTTWDVFPQYEEQPHALFDALAAGDERACWRLLERAQGAASGALILWL